MEQERRLSDVDRRLLAALAANPRAGIVALASTCQVARNTAQAHLDKLLRDGVITGFGPEIDLRQLGYGLMALVGLEISQAQGRPVYEFLEDVPEVIEAWMTSGSSDVTCRVVAHDSGHLAQILLQIFAIPGVARTTTTLILETRIASRSLHLVT